MNIFMKTKKSGFTLIEVLIVVAIIGILASVVLVGLGASRGRARDSRRIADLHQTQNALELYYTKNGAYPPSQASWAGLETELVNAAIGVTNIGDDPLGGTRHYSYGVSADRQSYVLKASLENASDKSLSDDVDSTVFGVDCGVAASDTEYCVQL